MQPHQLVLSCYYLDAALDADDERFVARTLTGPWARFKTGARSLRQIRVPAVLPLPDEDGGYAESREQRARHVQLNLQHAGIRTDAGHQVVWVMPRDTEWDAIFQFAIRIETGFAPFVAQRWFMQGSDVVRGRVRVVDTEMLLRGIEPK